MRSKECVESLAYGLGYMTQVQGSRKYEQIIFYLLFLPYPDILGFPLSGRGCSGCLLAFMPMIGHAFSVVKSEFLIRERPLPGSKRIGWIPALDDCVGYALVGITRALRRPHGEHPERATTRVTPTMGLWGVLV